MGFCFLDFKTDFEHNNYPRTVTYIDETLETCLVVPKTVARRRYCMKYFENCTDARDFIATFNCTLVLVNIDVKDSLSVIPMIRKDGIRKPIIFMINDRSEIGKVKAAGADDYIIKPFSRGKLGQLLALYLGNPSGYEKTYRVRDLYVNTETRTVKRGGSLIKLTDTEYRALLYFLKNYGMAISREMFREEILRYNVSANHNALDVCICRLRKKIDNGYDTKLIHTLNGLGYALY